MWVSERVAEDGGATVYFLSREGRFLKEVHDRVVQRTRYPLTQARVLEASRLSTFSASLSEPPIAADFDQYISMYGLPSFRTLLEGSGLARHDEVAKWEEASPRLVKVCASTAPSKVKLAGIFSDPVFTSMLRERAALRKSQLLRYLAELGVASHDRVFIADVGWVGSIQDNLARALPAVEWRGHYLFLRPGRSAAPHNSSKAAYLFDGRSRNNFFLERRMRFVKPIELLATGLGGSTIGYTLGDNGVVIDKVQGPDEEALRDHWRPFQLRVLDRIDQLDHALIARNSPEQLLRALQALIHFPPLDLAHAYLQSPREEQFGHAECFAALACDRSVGLRRLSIPQLYHSNWPHAVLVDRYGSTISGRTAVAAFDFADKAKDLVKVVLARR